MSNICNETAVKKFKLKNMVSLLVATSVAMGTFAANNALSQDAQIAPIIADATKASFKEFDPQNILIIETNKGKVVVALDPNIAPKQVERIKTLARRGFYNGVVFHRVIDGFMAQTGDPTGTGTGGSDLPDLEGEFTFPRDKNTPFTEATNMNGKSLGYVDFLPVTSQPSALLNLLKSGKLSVFANHCQGTASMARAMDPNSANSQFFLMRGETPTLNGKYSVWGRVIEGQDVVNSIKVGEPVVNPDKITKAYLLADAKDKNAVKYYYEDVNSDYFKTRLAAEVVAKGEDFKVCDFSPLFKSE